MNQNPDLQESQSQMEESTTSLHRSALVMASMPVAQRRPLSVARQIRSPVTDYSNNPAAIKHTYTYMPVFRKKMCLIHVSNTVKQLVVCYILQNMQFGFSFWTKPV
jgi:hypothetical protein